MAAAVVTATWLTDNGVPAQVMDLMTLGGFEGLTALLPGISARGLEVWVEDPSRAPEARRLLAEHDAARGQREAEAQQQGPTEVVCEECGGHSLFPASQHGTVQECPLCGAYVDVEGPDEPSAAVGDDDEAEDLEEG
jgi:hypothetical protein